MKNIFGILCYIWDWNQINASFFFYPRCWNLLWWQNSIYHRTRTETILELACFSSSEFSEDIMIYGFVKVQLFWEGHKNVRNRPYGFKIYLVNVKTMRTIAQIFHIYKFLWLSQKSWTLKGEIAKFFQFRLKTIKPQNFYFIGSYIHVRWWKRNKRLVC